MAPTLGAAEASTGLPDRLILLNEKFKVQSYDGGSFKNRAQYDIKNALIPIIEPFHCSGSGTKFNLVLKCSEDFTLTHFYISGPGQRCTEPIKSGLVWVTDSPPKVESAKQYDSMSSEEIMSVMKGFHSVGSGDEENGLPEPCAYFLTDANSREAEVELSRWREGKYVTVKFLDTHKDQVNIDVGFIALIGYFGRHSKQQRPLGPWTKRQVRQIWVHPSPLKSMFSSSGWVCDGRDFTGGCRSGQTDFHQTSVYTVTFRCTTSGFDLCEKCAYDPELGQVTDVSLQSDLDALSDPALCKLAVTRLRNQWRRNWLVTLPKYFQHGLLDSLITALQRSIEGSNGRPDEERSISQRQQHGGPETQKRQVRRALLQFMTELTQRLLCSEPVGEINVNDLVWSLCREQEEHWDEGRVIRLPETLPESSTQGDSPDASPALPEASSDSPAAPDAPASTSVGSDGSGYLISWRDGQAPSRVPARNVWKMTADEDVMMATVNLFLEVSKGQTCELEKVTKFLEQGADLMAADGEGTTVLHAALSSEAPVEVIAALLDNGACPEISNWQGITPLHVVLTSRSQAEADPDAAPDVRSRNVARLDSYAEVLRQHGGRQPEDTCPRKRLEQLRETFALKMIGALLTLQSPPLLPVEILEVLHMLFRYVPVSILKQALEPQAFHALTALLQHFVGGTDNLNTALIGCRMMRALHSHPDEMLRHLVQSHGALRWAQCLSTTKDFAQCGLYRQLQHEKVAPEELCREAKALCSQLTNSDMVAGGDGEDWQAGTQLIELSRSLDLQSLQVSDPLSAAKEALLSLRELLKRTEKGTATEERCTAFELEQHNVPARLLQFLKYQAPPELIADALRQPSLNTEQWAYFRGVFSEQTKQTRKGLVRLIKALHAVIETGEVFPVWRHKRERGLKALTEPLSLKMKCVGDGTCPVPSVPQVSITVEPLATIGEISRYLVRVTPTVNKQYLAWCHRLCGATISERSSGARFEVLSFAILHSDLPLPIHTVCREGAEEQQRMLLGVRDYCVVRPSTGYISQLDFQVALNLLHVVSGSSGFPSLLDDVARAICCTDVSPDLTTALAALPSSVNKEAVQLAFQDALRAASSHVEEAFAVVELMQARIAAMSAGLDEDGAAAGGASGEAPVDPTMRVHTVMIAVSDEIPFELFWPMVRDDIIGAVRELFPRAANAQMEEAVQAGVGQNGMGPIAKRLTLEEAETLAARVGHVVQTAVTVDTQAVQEVQRERAKSAQSETIPVSSRVQFSPKSGDNWMPGVVVGHGAQEGQRAEKFDIIDEEGLVWERLPRSRVRIPPGRRESPSSMGTPTQAVLSQSDLVRIRQHLRRRQEEWVERHAALGNAASNAGSGSAAANAAGGAAASIAPAPRADSASAGASGAAAADRPLNSRPTSAPAIAQRPRAMMPGSAESPSSAAGRRNSGDRETFMSGDVSLGEVDVNSALEMVHYVEDEAFAHEEFDDDGEGGEDRVEEGDEDEEDLPQLESSEAGDSQADAVLGPRLGGSRLREGDGDGTGEGGASMEEELRVLEQLRAMEQIISEVLEPQEVSSRARRDGSSSGEDFFSASLANLRIRMGNGGEQTYSIRRAGGSRGSERGNGPVPEALRGDFPAFVRAADSANPTSSLDHPVVERLGAADLLNDEAVLDEPTEPLDESAGVAADAGTSRCPQPIVRFCLYQAPVESAASKQEAPAAGAASLASPEMPSAVAASAEGDPDAVNADAQNAESSATTVNQPLMAPIALPATWNLLKAMQFLSDQRHLRASADAGADAAASAAGAPPSVLQALQKVSLDNWSVGYMLDVSGLDGETAAVGPVSVFGVAAVADTSALYERPPLQMPARSSGLSRKRRPAQSKQAAPDQVAREIYLRFTADSLAEGGPHWLLTKCGENNAVTDAIELLHLLKAQGPSLGVEPGLWVSSKLDRKLRYQLEDPLSVVSGTLPFWATALPRICPFLFSLKTRKMLLKYTAFGPSFAVHWTQESKVGSFLRRRATVQTELNAQMDPRKIQELSQELSNIEEHVVKSNFWLGTLQSTLVRMQKGDELLRQSDIAMELVCDSGHLVEVQFDGETGFGSAVTQSFYVEVAQMLQDRAINRRIPMWLEDDDSTNSQYLLCRRGLVIRPLVDGPQRDEAVRRFRFLGRLMGQALREGFIVPLPLAEEFFALVLGEKLTPANFPHPGSGSAGELCGVLADFAAELATGQSVLGPDCSSEALEAWRREQGERLDFAERYLHAHDHVEGAPSQQLSFNQYASMVGLCFMETGLSGAPLCPDGDNMSVTIDNVCEFVDRAASFWFDVGIAAQVEAFRAGLNDVFPFECLVAFTRSELREMFCGEDRVEWDEQALLSHLHPVGGLTDKSPVYKYLVAELLEMSQSERSRFLDFVSSCPRLPPGGIAKFHVDVFPDATSKQGYPRSRACANQLYLPPYGSREELHEKLHEAMHCLAGHHEQRVRDL